MPTPTPSPPLQLKSFTVPYMVGARVMWETPLDGLRAGVSVQALRLEWDYVIPASGDTPATPFSLEIPFELWLASVEYNLNELRLAAEYGRWSADVESSLAPTKSVVNERFYLMGSYQVRPWFTPGAYFAYLVPNVDKREGRENYRHDAALTLRFDVNPFWIVKLEGHYMIGTAELEPALNDGTTADKLAEHWAMFLAKTSVSF